MAAYIFAQIDVTNPDGYAEYMKRVPDVIEQYGGNVLSRAGRTEVLEGNPRVGRVVVIEFPSFEQGRKFWNSPEYQSVRKYSMGNAERDITLVEAT